MPVVRREPATSFSFAFDFRRRHEPLERALLKPAWKMTAARTVRHWLLAAGVLTMCFPAAFMLTLFLLPVWSWFEAAYAIESVGHSGPADWCFWLVYGVLVAISIAALLRRKKTKPTSVAG